MEKIGFLGCSRGLGKAVIQSWDFPTQAFAFSRNSENLQKIKVQSGVNLNLQSLDFSRQENLNEMTIQLKALNLDRLFYFAGGGPFGSFTEKKWQDHQWALQVSFLTPAYLLHQLTDIKQMVFVGSTIADSSADPKAASYAAAKHGLKGLMTSLIAEGDSRDLRLFRPGYMDTDLLPPNAAPRLEGKSLLSPEYAAEQFIQWVKKPADSVLSLDS